MNNYGIGTPLNVQWHLTKPDGTPFSLAGYTYTLKYRTSRGSGIARSTNVLTDDDGNLSNIIVWNFGGNEQVSTGIYDLELTIYRSGKKLCQSTYLGAFSLEKHVQKYPELIHTLSRGVNMPGEHTALVELFSAAEWWMYKPVEPVAGSDGFWYVNGVVVTDDNGNKVPTKYGIKYNEEDQCLYVFTGIPGEESYQEVQRITDISDMLTYAKETFESNESSRQSTFEANERTRKSAFDSAISTFEKNEETRQAEFEKNEETRQENEIKREEKYDELVAFVRSASEQIATADTLQGGWYRCDTPIRLASNTVVSIKANGSSAYALLNSSGTVLASSDGDDDLVYTTSSTGNYYVASRSQGETIQYKLMVIADKKIQDSASEIDDLLRLGFKASCSVSPSAVEGETEVVVTPSLVGFNNSSVTPDDATYKVGSTEYKVNRFKVPGAVTINVTLSKGGHEYTQNLSVSGYRYVYWGIGSSAAAVKASGKNWKTSGTTPVKSGGYAVDATTASGQYFYYLLPSGMTSPAKFLTDGFDFPCSVVDSETVSGYKIYRSDATIASGQAFTVTISI